MNMTFTSDPSKKIYAVVVETASAYEKVSICV